MMAETRGEARSANKFDSGAIGGFLRASALSTVLRGTAGKIRRREVEVKAQEEAWMSGLRGRNGFALQSPMFPHGGEGAKAFGWR